MSRFRNVLALLLLALAAMVAGRTHAASCVDNIAMAAPASLTVQG